ncbi:MAG TPA: prepilin-type N-terminal cleavage/methylation domain-containing protein, partial [Candidatus Binatus sp.]|nr:prepilin-type N-terminal cleavage/methylation domain-containing protein [Candidatus Binatus sp.]
MSSAFRRRGFTLFEALIALAILFLLIFVVGDAVERMLHHASTTVGRADQARSASELAIRMNEEARSSTAIFLPMTDVLGNDNSGTAVHEIDFFRRLSAGGDTYVAYRFDQPTGAVTRYEYTLTAGSVTIVHSDQLADGISALSAQRLPAGSLADVVSPASVADVSLLYGT